MRDMTDQTPPRDPRRQDIAGLAQSVVRILSERGVALEEDNRAARIEALLAAVRDPAPEALDMFLAEYDAAGLSRVRLIDTIVPDVAARMGEMWLDDTMGFDAVSLATTRLQRLLARIAPPVDQSDPDRCDAAVLLIAQACDTHRLGAQLLATLLRRRGLAVRLVAAPTTDEVARLIEGGTFDALFFSCSGLAPLAKMQDMLQALRRRLTLPTTVLGGGLLTDHRNAAEASGVDLVTNDIERAISHAVQSKSHIRKAGS